MESLNLNVSNKRESIKVVCRVRPENRFEKESNYTKCLQISNENTLQLQVPYYY